MITNVNIENLPSYELGMEKGMTNGIHMIVKQLLLKNPPEVVADMTNLSLGEVMDIKNSNTH